VGVADPDAIHRAVDNVAYNNCAPPITVVQENLTTEDGAVVVVVNVPKGSLRPYRTQAGRYCIRTTSGCRDASREELLRLFQAVESLFFDETPMARLGIRDLDLDALGDFLRRTGQDDLADMPHEALLRNWRMLANGNPTIAGLLFFGRRPQEHLPYAQVNAARFPATDSADDPMDRKDIRGRMLEVVDDTVRFLNLHLRAPHVIKGFEPEPRPELPEEALREAIVNAVAHRDYTIQGPIRLFIFDDRIEFRTPGRPPNSVDEAAMRAGIHVPRNPTVYARLSDAGLVTRAGTGIRRIVKRVREATGQEVTIEIGSVETVLTIPRPA
jgi:ATP-dependent DNA helicase RecG